MHPVKVNKVTKQHVETKTNPAICQYIRAKEIFDKFLTFFIISYSRRNSGTAIVHLVGNIGSFSSPLLLYAVSIILHSYIPNS